MDQHIYKGEVVNPRHENRKENQPQILNMVMSFAKFHFVLVLVC